MMKDGWIKLYRNVTNWRLYDNDFMFKFFVTLLADASVYEKKWNGTTIKRGQILTSISHLSRQFNKTPRQIRTALDNMDGEEIEITTTNRYTVISIKNYELYQDRCQTECQTECNENDKRNDKRNDKQNDKQRARQKDSLNNSYYDSCEYDETKENAKNVKRNDKRNDKRNVTKMSNEMSNEMSTTKEDKEDKEERIKKEIHTNVCKEKKLSADAEIFSSEKDSGNNAQLIPEEKEKEKKVAPKRESRFVPPTLEEVKDYEAQKGYTFSAEKFWGYYESNGWRVGKNPMKNWHGACVTWQGKQNEENNNLNLNNNATIQPTGGRASANEPGWLRHQRENEEYLQYHLKRAMSKINTKDDDKDVNGIF